MKRLLIIAVLSLVSFKAVEAKRKHLEVFYQKKYCSKVSGEIEVRLADRTRVDCLTDTHAIELDFADKWAEAVGQSLHYASLTGKKAGIILIIESNNDKKFVDRLKNLIKYHKLDIMVDITYRGKR